MLRSFLPALAAISLLWAVVVAAGCSGAPKSTEDENTTDLREIAKAYSVTISAHRRPPKSLDEIKSVLADLHEANLVGKPEDVLKSSRDGQPYVIILGADLGATRSGEVLAYEKKGAGGKRYVLSMDFNVGQISDADFAKANFAMGHLPAKD
jgi:hypothetical protein